MTVPIGLIVTAAAFCCLLVLATILMFFAWKGMELENRELRSRLAIVQVDVSGLLGRAAPPAYTHGRLMIDQPVSAGGNNLARCRACRSVLQAGEVGECLNCWEARQV